MICIPACTISILASKMYWIDQNKAWKIRSQFIILDFFICMLYLTCIASFYMREYQYTHEYDLYACRYNNEKIKVN